MAKSIRSKWRRKCRAVKRERYGQKELERLKKTLANDPTVIVSKLKMDCEDIVTVIDDVRTIQNTSISEDDVQEVIQSEGPLQNANQEDGNGKKKVYNPKTMRDQYGGFPVWLHPRKARQHSKKAKILKKKKQK